MKHEKVSDCKNNQECGKVAEIDQTQRDQRKYVKGNKPGTELLNYDKCDYRRKKETPYKSTRALSMYVKYVTTSQQPW